MILFIVPQIYRCIYIYIKYGVVFHTVIEFGKPWSVCWVVERHLHVMYICAIESGTYTCPEQFKKQTEGRIVK